MGKNTVSGLLALLLGLFGQSMQAEISANTAVHLGGSGPAPASAALGAVSFAVDDGTSETSIGDAGQFIWLNRFTPAPGDFPFLLEEVQVQFGSTNVTVGDPIEIFIHSDTDGDGDPATGSVLLANYTGTVQFNNSTNFSVYALVPPVMINGPGDVLVGVVNRVGFEGFSDFPAAIDTTASQGRSWVGSYLAGDVPAAPFYPADEQWGTIDSFGFPGNWMIRASGTRVLDADVSVSKSATVVPNPLLIGSVISYTLNVTNNGPGPATAVLVTDTLPANLTYVSNDCAAVFAAPVLTWTVGDLGIGASQSCTLTASVSDFGTIVNTASATASSVDPNAGNNSATDTLAGVPFPADVAVTLGADAVANQGVGSQFTYTVSANNLGPGDASDLIFNLSLSNKVSVVSNTCSAVVNGGVVSWTVASLANGTSTSCQIVVAVVAPGDLLASVSVSTSTVDPDLGNNSAELSLGFAALPVPALGALGMLLVALLMLGIGAVVIRR